MFYRLMKMAAAVCCLLVGGCFAIPPVKSRVGSDVVYTRLSWPEALTADVYRPAGTAPAPAVLLLHGSGWRDGGSRWQMHGIARKLVKRGYVVVNAEYRFIPDVRYPAPLEDAREALRWMKSHSTEYGIDPKRIATFGYSAGGYLAALVALDDESGAAGVRAVVAGGAPFDLEFYARGDLIPVYLGGGLHEIPEVYRDASPVNHVRRSSPPIFMYQGTRDRLVRPEHALRMRQVCKELGCYLRAALGRPWPHRHVPFSGWDGGRGDRFSGLGNAVSTPIIRARPAA